MAHHMAPAVPSAPPLQPGLGEVMAVAGGVAPTAAPHEAPPPPPDLERRLRRPRTLFSAAMSVLARGMAVTAMVPLVSVLVMLVWRGGQRLGVALVVH